MSPDLILLSRNTVQTPNFVVHVEEKDGELTVRAHRKRAGKEGQPLAYLTGYNILILPPEGK